jgi:hypothetical protein
MGNIVVNILQEAGYEAAMRGIALNKLQNVANMPRVAAKLSKANAGSHRKFLRQIVVWLEIEAPLYFWSEMDTYRIGVTRNSASTMHTPLLLTVLAEGCTPATIAAFEEARALFDADQLTIQEYKANIPSGLMLKSVLSMNYEVLRTIINDRKNHRLPEWPELCNQVLFQIEHPEFLGEQS